LMVKLLKFMIVVVPYTVFIIHSVLILIPLLLIKLRIGPVLRQAGVPQIPGHAKAMRYRLQGQKSPVPWVTGPPLPLMIARNVSPRYSPDTGHGDLLMVFFRDTVFSWLVTCPPPFFKIFGTVRVP